MADLPKWSKQLLEKSDTSEWIREMLAFMYQRHAKKTSTIFGILEINYLYDLPWARFLLTKSLYRVGFKLYVK